jgi:hypothetical protein
MKICDITGLSVHRKARRSRSVRSHASRGKQKIGTIYDMYGVAHHYVAGTL